MYTVAHQYESLSSHQAPLHVYQCQILILYLHHFGCFIFLVQSNLDYPYLDYPDFSIIRTFSLVPILSWIFISHDQDP